MPEKQNYYKKNIRFKQSNIDVQTLNKINTPILLLWQLDQERSGIVSEKNKPIIIFYNKNHKKKSFFK